MPDRGWQQTHGSTSLSVARRAWTLVFALVVVAGCGSGTAFTPSSTQLKAGATGNFVLYVSDQSFKLDHVDITIRIDGKVAVSDQFAVGNEHNWKQYRFQLDPGLHHITAISHRGQAQVVGTFRMKQKLNGAVDYRYSPGNSGVENANSPSITRPTRSPSPSPGHLGDPRVGR